MPGRAAPTLPAIVSSSLKSNNNHTFNKWLAWPQWLLCPECFFCHVSPEWLQLPAWLQSPGWLPPLS